MNSSNSQSWGTALLRIMVGIVFLMHGRQKLFVFGFHGVAGMFGHIGIPFPAFFAPAVTLLEFVGGAALVFGLFTRWIFASAGFRHARSRARGQAQGRIHGFRWFRV